MSDWKQIITRIDGTEALRYASAAAAIYASRPAGWEFLPAAADVEALLSRGEGHHPPNEEIKVAAGELIVAATGPV